MQAGLRVENTFSKSQLTRADGLRQADGAIDRNYTDLFPSAAFTYIASADHLFNLNYSRRIDRPNYSDLNPFEARVDELTFMDMAELVTVVIHIDPELEPDISWNCVIKGAIFPVSVL